MEKETLNSVKDVCEKYGITRKTLFYYDRVGLLKPTDRIGRQQFKYYDDQALLRLETILEYRAAGLAIGEIKEAIDLKDKTEILQILIKVKDRLDAQEQRKREEIKRLDVLIRLNS